MKAADLLRGGASIQAAAEAVGVTTNTVKRWRRDYPAVRAAMVPVTDDERRLLAERDTAMADPANANNPRMTAWADGRAAWVAWAMCRRGVSLVDAAAVVGASLADAERYVHECDGR